MGRIVELSGRLKSGPKMLILLLQRDWVIPPARQSTRIIRFGVFGSNDIHNSIIDGYVYVTIGFEAAHAVVDLCVMLAVSSFINVGSLENHNSKFVAALLIGYAVLTGISA